MSITPIYVGLALAGLACAIEIHYEVTLRRASLQRCVQKLRLRLTLEVLSSVTVPTESANPPAGRFPDTTSVKVDLVLPVWRMR